MFIFIVRQYEQLVQTKIRKKIPFQVRFLYLSSQMLFSLLHLRGSSQGRHGVCRPVRRGGGVPVCEVVVSAAPQKPAKASRLTMFFLVEVLPLTQYRLEIMGRY